MLYWNRHDVRLVNLATGMILKRHQTIGLAYGQNYKRGGIHEKRGGIA